MGLQVLEGPRYPQIWFGDGMWVQMVRKRRQNDDKGREGYLFLMKPSRELIATYGEEIRELIDPKTGLMTEWYPKKWVKILSDDPVIGKILVKCDFLRRPTTQLCMENADKDQIIEHLEMLCDSYKAANAHLQEEIQIARNDIKRYIDENAEIFMSARKVAGKTKTEEDESKAEED